MKFTHPPGATPVDGFTIRRGIHRGGFGEVYYAVSDAGKEVALKLLQHEQDIELRGVTQCLNLKHPNLVNLFDVKTDSHGESWVVMEYVNGTSLEDVLAAFPNGLPLDEVRDWLTGLVAGVSHLHDRGIVHRDLKPANVYRENGTVKIGDVGLSKKLGSDRRGAHTQSVGTVYYMAPEVAKGQYGPEVDVYSLGIMLYELLTGHVPFTGETTAEILMKHLTARPNLAPLPERLRAVVARALEKDPHLRTSSVRQLGEDFLQAIEDRPSCETTPQSLPWRGWSGRPANPTGTTNGHVTGFATGTPTAADSSAAVTVHTVTSNGVSHETASTTPPPVPVKAKAERSVSTRVGDSQGRSQVMEPSSTTVSDARRFFLLAAMLAGGLIVFSPGTPRAWAGLGLIGLAYSATLFLRPSRFSGLSTGAVTPLQEALAAPVDVSRERASAWSNLPLGSLLSRQSVGETTVSLSLASLCACLLSSGALYAQEFFHRSAAPAAEMMALLMTTTLAGSWAILLANQCVKRTSWGEGHPRWVNLFAGVCVGSLACLLDQFLLVEFSQRYFERQPAFRQLGVHSLTTEAMNPTWLGYVVFFGGVFFLHRWWLDVDPHRTRRLSVGRMFSAGLAAWLMTVFFAFPEWPALLWGATLSATVQLATPWTGPRRREAFWRN